MEIEENTIWLNWLNDTLAHRPPRPNQYIDTERGYEVVKMLLDFERDNFAWRRSDEDTFWLDVQLFVKYRLSNAEILFVAKMQGGIENYKKHSDERKAYAELKRGLDKLRAINAR